MKILLADEQVILRKGMRAVLEAHSDWFVCSETNNGRDAVKLALELKPDIVILDVEIPELDGVEATRQIRRALPDTEVLIFTLQDAEWLIADVLRAGARGYLRKTESEQKLIDAVEALAGHAPFFSANVVEMLLRHL